LISAQTPPAFVAKDHNSCLSMIISENRFPLFRIML